MKKLVFLSPSFVSENVVSVRLRLRIHYYVPMKRTNFHFPVGLRFNTNMLIFLFQTCPFIVFHFCLVSTCQLLLSREYLRFSALTVAPAVRGRTSRTVARLPWWMWVRKRARLEPRPRTPKCVLARESPK